MNKQRLEIAVQAARLLAEDGSMDYFSAKQKAVKICGANNRLDLPTNLEIETQLKIFQSLDDPAERRALLHDMREDALRVMQLFEQFDPMLVGAVLEGTAVDNSPIEIHIFADSVKEVAIFLLGEKIPFESLDQTLRLNKHEAFDVPVLQLYMEEREIMLSVLEYKMLRQKPISPISLRPMARANIKKVKSLLEGASGCDLQ